MRGFGVGGFKSLGGMNRTFGLQRDYGNPQRPTVQITRALVKRVLQHFKPYRWQWAVIFVCIAASAYLTALSPQVVRAILDQAIPQKNVPYLYWLAGAIVALALLTNLFGLLQNYLSMRVGQRIMYGPAQLPLPAPPAPVPRLLYRHSRRRNRLAPQQ